MKPKKLYAELASLCAARVNCQAANNQEWLSRHTERIESLVKQYLPSGSGFDSGTTLDLDATDRHAGAVLVFQTSFHHMNENGMYDGWTEHTITVKPSLAHGFTLNISGKNRNEIKEYIAECFGLALGDEEWSLREEYLRLVVGMPHIKIASRWQDQCTQVWTCGEKEFRSFADAVPYALELASLVPTVA